MPLLTTFKEQVQPEHTAILIVDMQNDFCSGDGYLSKTREYNVSNMPHMAQTIGELVDVARLTGTEVVWIRSHYDFKYLTPSDRVKRQQEGLVLEGSWGADFFMIAPIQDELIVTKHRFSGFSGTSLDDLLRARGIKTLIMTGVATNVCVDSTLRDGFFRGYHIILAEDCVGSNNKVGHDGTIATVRNNIGIVAQSSEIIDVLKMARELT